MHDWKEELKAEKKRAKAAAKAAKKAAKAAGAMNVPAAGDKAEPTPAERAAAAAEQQVRLQRWRLIVALAGVIVALIGVLLSAVLSFGRPPLQLAALPPLHNASGSHPARSTS